jgi:hypothetical protein
VLFDDGLEAVMQIESAAVSFQRCVAMSLVSTKGKIKAATGWGKLEEERDGVMSLETYRHHGPE